MRYLKQACINHVARDITRTKISPLLSHQEQLQQWYDMQATHRQEAEEKINSMTNLELLDLIDAMGFPL